MDLKQIWFFYLKGQPTVNYEIDGSSHNIHSKKSFCKKRDEYLSSDRSLKIIRINVSPSNDNNSNNRNNNNQNIIQRSDTNTSTLNSSNRKSWKSSSK